LIVVKSGGTIIEKRLPDDVILDIKKTLTSNSIIFVHGGGVEVTKIASKLGKEQKFIVSPNGFRSRYTDKETAKIYTMVMTGKLNKQIILALQSHGIPAIGISGLDGSLLKAERKKRLIIIDERGRRRIINGGYTGKILDVNTKLLNLLIDSGYVPVLAPVAISEEFEPLNVDGDRTAAYVAGYVKADKLILLTDVEGLILNGELISKLTAKEAKEQLHRIGHGMITKIYAAIEALNMGVREVIITSGYIKQPISSSMTHKRGTVISNE
jgi:acetylglutamate/LysW-gamma-L-alpha-aminoadipate kinase